MNIKKIFGSNLKKYRKKVNLTQEELAEKLNISTKHLSNIEVGQKFISSDLLEKIHDVLKVSPSSLFYSPGLDRIDDDYFSRIDKLISGNADELKEMIREMKEGYGSSDK